jgi:hypothetical protein
MQNLFHSISGRSSQLCALYRRGNARLGLMLALLFTSGNLALAQSSSPTYVSPPVRPYAANVDLRTLPTATSEVFDRSPGRPLLTIPGALKPPARAETKRPDPLWKQGGLSARELSVTPPEFSNPSPNFGGLASGATPPDANWAVGPDHYIQMVNIIRLVDIRTVHDALYEVFDKTGARLTEALALSSLWDAAQVPADDPCRAQGDGDPYVLYDHLV